MQRAERVASVVLVVFGLGVAYYSEHYLKLGHMISPGAGFLPYYIGIVLSALGVAWFVMTWLVRTPAPPSPADAAPVDAAQAEALRRSRILTRLLPGVALILAYAWLFEKAGYFASTVLFMVGWQKIVEREKWGKSLLIAVLCAVAMFALFSFLLKGVLPTGSWFS